MIFHLVVLRKRSREQKTHQQVLLWKALLRLLVEGPLRAVSHQLKNSKSTQRLLFKEDRKRQGYLLNWRLPPPKRSHLVHLYYEMKMVLMRSQLRRQLFKNLGGRQRKPSQQNYSMPMS
ncbi:TMEM237 isoform 3 [Pongo abelii]|uniref:TMEM237 isoform 3 n=1 Tax=Pongo abelii TaxID=9601 RepID=A0A2J8WV16_PONAB|nr:TMEM237 isoform 3 [Pongo abelii]